MSKALSADLRERALVSVAAGATLREAAGVSLRFLLPDSPDFNPIENVFATLKGLLKNSFEQRAVRKRVRGEDRTKFELGAKRATARRPARPPPRSRRTK